jgi:arabinofuranosyltransferase
MNGGVAAEAGARVQTQVDIDLWAAISLCVMLGLLFINSTRVTIAGDTYFTLHDDVMISMTYARNLAEGHGLVWTPGEPPLEGFTNPLWTLYMALLHVLTPGDQWAPPLVALSGMAGLVVGLLGVDALTRRLGASPAGRLFALLTAATLYAPAFWSIHGFEVSMLIALDVWMLAIALDRRRRDMRAAVLLGLLGSAALLLRLDSLLMSGAIIALRLLRRDWRGVREVALAGAMIGAVGAAMFAVRHAYYGEWLPNTAYLKLSSMPVLDRLWTGLSTDYHAAIRWLPIGVAALVPLVLRRGRSAELTLNVVAVLAVVALQFAYAAYVGGDAWEWSRFPNRYLSIMSFGLCACAGVGVGLLVERVWAPRASRRLVALGAAIAVFAWTSAAHWGATIAGAGFQWAEEKALVRSGLAIRDQAPPGFSYALTWAGAIPYYAEGRRPIDLLGKMDAVIARMEPAGVFKPGHNKYDLDHSLGALRPDALLQTPVAIEGELERKMRAWGYRPTEGGWWIREDAQDKVDPALLAHNFN